MNVRGVGPHAGQPVRLAGAPLDRAVAAVILLHGRGANAASILPLARELAAPGVAFLAPEAAGQTWYPFSFLAPLDQNEPWLSSALALVGDLVTQVEAAGVLAERIVIGGFSQGACLAADWVIRTPRRYGGLIAFSGGAIGPLGTQWNDTGDLAGMPAFLGCSTNDPHVPEERVRETAAHLERLGAVVDCRIYPGLGHTINRDELEAARAIVVAAAGGPR
ncbi:MAG: phospholipase/carboxylesterase [Dehalococcoidia bacterium]|nr:MAG: phospholipase/carboxylesterase [Dehalococcoidia bacterium]